MEMNKFLKEVEENLFGIGQDYGITNKRDQFEVFIGALFIK
ncbi:MAG: hypothetical protein Q8934_10840 [Bacillota bacterium]|nr:hypothetical protein [Bacillota bacterium]